MHYTRSRAGNSTEKNRNESGMVMLVYTIIAIDT